MSAGEPVLAVAGPWTNVYGTARSAAAAGTFLTLVFNPLDSLFRPFGATMSEAASRVNVISFSLFHALGEDHLALARGVSIATLALVMVGWRPRWLAIPHWYVAWSYSVATFNVDGGDQVASNLALLLVPVALTDNRRWHWSAPNAAKGSRANRAAVITAQSAWFVMRLQVCAIYVVAGVSKVRVPEWSDGTALYYWFTDPTFGSNLWVVALTEPLIVNATLVAVTTWGVIAFELLMGAAFVARPSVLGKLLPLAIAFHAAIVVVHGLVSFFFSMLAAAILYLRDPEREFGVPASLCRALVWYRARRNGSGLAQARSSLGVGVGGRM